MSCPPRQSAIGSLAPPFYVRVRRSLAPCSSVGHGRNPTERLSGRRMTAFCPSASHRGGERQASDLASWPHILPVPYPDAPPAAASRNVSATIAASCRVAGPGSASARCSFTRQGRQRRQAALVFAERAQVRRQAERGPDCQAEPGRRRPQTPARLALTKASRQEIPARSSASMATRRNRHGASIAATGAARRSPRATGRRARPGRSSASPSR